jgi:hypothetical protein
MSFNPGLTTVKVDEGAERLEKAADQLYDATKRYEDAEAAWDKKRLLEYARLYHQLNGKVPGEEVRLGLVLELHGDSEEYLEWIAAKAEVEALDKRYRAFAASVSARQSLLKVMP